MKTLHIQPAKEKLTGTVAIPGSKSYTNRALLLAALSPDTIRIENPLFSDDTQAMIACLQTLGVILIVEDDAITVSGSLADVTEKIYDLDANLSGTTIRFILALATIIPGKKIIRGKEGLNKRPIHDLVDALRQLGANIRYEEKEGFPPLVVESSKLSTGEVTVNGAISSQYLSALLMIAPAIGETTIRVMGKQISKPYVAMTIDIMQEFGVAVHQDEEGVYRIPAGQQYTHETYTVEGDFSSAGYFFAIAALTKSTITLTNVNPFSKQADTKLIAVLKEMGSRIIAKEDTITIVGNGVMPLIIHALDFPDQAQTLAVLAAFADGTTRITGIQSLRVKETERVVALQQELKKMGIKTEATHDTITIYGDSPKQATIDTYGDHRMAMAFAIAASILPGVKINDPEVVKKTFPDFWKKLQTLGLTIEEKEEK